MPTMHDRFGFEWEKYNSIKPEYREQYREQFLNWTHPLQPDFYTGKRILDAGCGMGRNSYWCLEWGAASLVGCDHDLRSVEAARETLKKFSNVELSQLDLEDLPWQNEFDFIFSIGVVHHTKHPDIVMKELYEALKPGGEVLLWVYSSVGYEGVLKILNPIRKYITSHMNLRLLHVVTYLCSIPLYAWIHLFPVKKPYFQQMKTFSFSHMHSILFDQLLPEIARYYSKDEAADLVSQFKDAEVYAPPNATGWIVRAKK